MMLTELSPRWMPFGRFERGGFIFRCPHCVARQPDGATWLLCKSMPLSFKDQAKVILEGKPVEDGSAYDLWPPDIVPMRDDAVWIITGEFKNLTVTPSIDASASGHWHGFITNGRIT